VDDGVGPAWRPRYPEVFVPNRPEPDSYIRLRRASPAVVSVELAGAIDLPSTSQLQHLLVDVLMHHRPARVVIDLRDATFLDPTAVGVLLAAADTADDLRVALSVCNPSPNLAEQLLSSGLPRQRVA
jgi:anti-anti-sigma factor